MSRLVLRLTAVSVLAGVASAFNCSIPPIYVDVHRRIVHGTDVFQYGSFIGVGTPAQNQSLWPSLRQNETSVAHVDYCSESTLQDCERSTRGNFDTSESSSWRPDDAYKSLDLDPTLEHEGIYGHDTLHLYTHYFETSPASENVIPDFMLEVATNGTVSPGVVGMGLSSTVLQELYNAGLISGRTFSLYIGSGFDRAGGVINGSLSFGGYDSGRFTGQVYNYTMDISNPHPLRVSVKDIIIQDSEAGSQNVSLFDRSRFPDMRDQPGSFEAKITTDQYPMSFPYQLTQNYMSLLSAEESDYPDGSLRLGKPFNGTMSIVLSDGFTVTIPSDVMYNVSGISPVAAREEDSEEPFYLSTSWLSQVYLMVDYEAYKFHLAQALAEAPFVTPETFCPKTVPHPYVHETKSGFESTGMIGAVIGGVFGGLGLIALVLSVFVFWRRRRAAKAEEQLENQTAMAKMAQFEVEISSGGSLEKSRKAPKWSFANLWK